MKRPSAVRAASRRDCRGGTPLSQPNLFLVFDVGTQSVRAGLVDPGGNILRLVKTAIEPYFSKKPGWAEQQPDYYWRTLANTSERLLADPNVTLERIAGVSLTCQRATVVNLDKNGTPLRPAILWLDQRKAENKPPLSPLIWWGLKTIRQHHRVEAAVRACKSNWIQQNEPYIWEKTHKFLLLSGFLTHRLTGEYRDSSANMVAYLPFDYPGQRWSSSMNMRWKLFAMDPSVLPVLVKPSEILGHITADASGATGIPKGLPLIASGTDKACEVLGAGCLTPEIACLSYGTTATVNTANTKYLQLKPFAPTFPAAVPGAYNMEVMVYRGFWLVSWFKEQFGSLEKARADQTHVPPEVLFDELISDIPAGSMGLMLQPYWSPGLYTDADAKGAVIGFGDVHTRAHLYRSILEGLGYALKQGMQLLEKKNGVPVRALRVSGGGSQSDAAMQITADIFDLPAERPHVYETSALGAAIDAAVGLGCYPNFEAAVTEMTRPGDVFEPVPENRDRYRELFERVYLKMYGRLRSLYHEIRKITGYPEM